MDWATRVTDLLGIQYPIIQGAFAGFGNSHIAAPVSEAGGLGIITAGALHTPEDLRADIRRLREITDKPFGVNITLILERNVVPGMLQVVLEEKVPVLFTAAYKADNLGRRAKEAGITWVHKVATIRHAVAAERHGADACVIVGIEGAGFKSAEQLPTLINMSVASRLVSIPLIAAGGIGDARGLLGALGMGADAVYMATAFMATQECPISPRYKQRLVESQPWDREVYDRALKPPSDAEVTRVMREKASMDEAEWLRSLETTIARSRQASNGQERQERSVAAAWANPLDDDSGEDAFRIGGGSLAVGVLDGVPTVKEFIDRIITDAERMLEEEGPLSRLKARVGGSSR